MSATTPPFDLYLGDIASLQGYRCRSLVRDSAPLVAPRFSSGAAGQTDLDLLKSASIDDLAGGMFQRDWQDPEKVARALGVFNQYDRNTYPTPPRSSANAVSAGYYPIAKAESDSYSFIAYGAFSAGTYYNIIDKYTYGGGRTNITLPAALANNGFTSITGMALHKNYLFVNSQNANGGGVAHYRYDIDAGTWQDLGVGSGVLFGTLRGGLYGINYVSQIYSVTNETSTTATTTALDVVGYASPSSQASDMKEFNGALWIAKPDGIYRFDGIKALKVLSLSTTSFTVFNGALYFVSGLWLYKFDGTNVTRVQFFGTQEIVGGAQAPGYNLSLSANSDYLFVASVVLTSGYSQSDKFSVSASGLHRIYSYDGAAFMLIHESNETVGTGYNPALLTTRNRLIDIFGNIPSTSWQTNWYSFSLDYLFTASAVTTASKLELTSSEFDDGYPNIFKSLELIEVNYTGLIAGDSLAVSYQLYDGKTWGSWISAGTLTSSTGNTIEITNNAQKLFKRAKVNVTASLAAGSTAALKGASVRYTLQPRARWRWQINIMAEGNSTTMDRSNTPIATDANALNNLLTQTIKQKTPTFFLSPDYGLVKTGISNAALSFIIKGQAPIYTDPYSEYQLCAVKNSNGVWEVLRVATVSYNSGTDETTITVLERGYYGVTPASISANAEFHLAYKVFVTRLLRDNPTLDETVYNEQSTGESQLQREFLLEVTEV